MLCVRIFAYFIHYLFTHLFIPQEWAFWARILLSYLCVLCFGTCPWDVYQVTATGKDPQLLWWEESLHYGSLRRTFPYKDPCDYIMPTWII